MGHLGPKRGQNEVFGHFLIQKALDFADFAYFMIENNNVQYLMLITAEKKKKFLK